MVVIMGTLTYGEDISTGFSTYEELTFLCEEKKPFFLVKMCKHFGEEKTRVLLPSAAPAPKVQFNENNYKAVIAAMKKHPANAEVQQMGCMALGLFSHDKTMLAAEAGSIEAIVAAMRAHPSNADVQQYGCNALCEIAFNAANQVLVAKAGGIEAVVAAMRTHL